MRIEMCTPCPDRTDKVGPPVLPGNVRGECHRHWQLERDHGLAAHDGQHYVGPRAQQQLLQVGWLPLGLIWAHDGVGQGGAAVIEGAAAVRV